MIEIWDARILGPTVYLIRKVMLPACRLSVTVCLHWKELDLPAMVSATLAGRLPRRGSR